MPVVITSLTLPTIPSIAGQSSGVMPLEVCLSCGTERSVLELAEDDSEVTATLNIRGTAGA